MYFLEQQIGDQGGDDLEAYGFWVFGQESLDLEVLLDPFEEEFDLPSALIEVGDLFGVALEIICDEGEFTAFVFIEDLDPAQGFFCICALAVQPGLWSRRRRSKSWDGTCVAARHRPDWTLAG